MALDSGKMGKKLYAVIRLAGFAPAWKTYPWASNYTNVSYLKLNWYGHCFLRSYCRPQTCIFTLVSHAMTTFQASGESPPRESSRIHTTSVLSYRFPSWRRKTIVAFPSGPRRIDLAYHPCQACFDLLHFSPIRSHAQQIRLSPWGFCVTAIGFGAWKTVQYDTKTEPSLESLDMMLGAVLMLRLSTCYSAAETQQSSY